MKKLLLFFLLAAPLLHSSDHKKKKHPESDQGQKDKERTRKPSPSGHVTNGFSSKNRAIEKNLIIAIFNDRQFKKLNSFVDDLFTP